MLSVSKMSSMLSMSSSSMKYIVIFSPLNLVVSYSLKYLKVLYLEHILWSISYSSHAFKNPCSRVEGAPSLGLSPGCAVVAKKHLCFDKQNQGPAILLRCT